MRALEFSLFSRDNNKIDDNVDISHAKIENTSMIFLQLKLSNREPFFKNPSVSCNAMMKFF